MLRPNRIVITLNHRKRDVHRLLVFFTLFPWIAVAQSLTVPDGNMELPVVGAWSTTMPTAWTWSAGAGVETVGLTSTGGANGSQQTLYGNQLAGTLTTATFPQPFAGTGTATLFYWAKRENSGSYTVTASLMVGGVAVASRTDTFQTNVWTQLALNYLVTATDMWERQFKSSLPFLAAVHGRDIWTRSHWRFQIRCRLLALAAPILFSRIPILPAP